MDKLNRIAAVIALCILTLVAGAQDTMANNATSGDFMTSNGKIYVVMAVVVTIVVGLFIYLLNLDRKMSKMEKKS